MKKLLVIVFLLMASFVYSQDYQSDYKNMFGKWESTPPFEFIVAFHKTKDDIEVVEELIKPKVEFMSTGIKVTSRIVYFFPYSKISEVISYGDRLTIFLIK